MIGGLVNYLWFMDCSAIVSGVSIQNYINFKCCGEI